MAALHKVEMYNDAENVVRDKVSQIVEAVGIDIDQLPSIPFAKPGEISEISLQHPDAGPKDGTVMYKIDQGAQ